MGREAVTTVEWLGEVAEVKALLETSEIILRGDIKARLPLALVRTPRVEDGDLLLRHDGRELRLSLGADEAAKWLKKLTTPGPTLAEKLGLKEGTKAWVTGPFSEDSILSEALAGATSGPEQAAVFIAVVLSVSAFEQAVSDALAHPHLPVWFVHEKGKPAQVSDALIRVRMRSEGWIDTKTSAVSDRLTTTRYNQRKDGVR